MYISDEIIKILEYLCDKIGITFDWTSNNVLPYLEQICEKFIRYEIGTSIAWLIIGVICLFFTKWAFKKSKHIKEEIADNIHIIWQFTAFYGISVAEILDEVERKNKRTIRRMEEKDEQSR